MKKVLFTAKVDSHILAFHVPFLKYFKEKGYEVHVASEGNEQIPYCDKKYDIKFGVNPFRRDVIKTYKQIKMIINDNSFEVVHTHTAIASVLTRISLNKKNNPNSRMIYTAHGFHFHRHGRMLDWLMFFPVELFCSIFTDDLILINKEDFTLAQKFKMGKRIHLINGIGVDLDKFTYIDVNEYKERYQDKDFFNITYVAELNKNKNQISLLKSIKNLSIDYPNIHLNLIGEGDKMSDYKKYVKKHNLQDFVTFHGYRFDVETLLRSTDLYISPSLREGLGINLIEAISTGIFCIAYSGRGHNEVIIDGHNGRLIDRNERKLKSEIEKILSSTELIRLSREESDSVQKFSINKIMKQMINIYENCDNNE